MQAPVVIAVFEQVDLEARPGEDVHEQAVVVDDAVVRTQPCGLRRSSCSRWVGIQPSQRCVPAPMITRSGTSAGNVVKSSAPGLGSSMRVVDVRPQSATVPFSRSTAAT